MNELGWFLDHWERLSAGTLELMRALPEDSYDFRPDSGARSIGELAWHLAELDSYISAGAERGDMRGLAKPPNMERPRAVSELAPAYERVHREAVARIARLTAADLDREVPYIDGTPIPIRDLLWQRLLLHAAHHRGQLAVLCRLAGGVAPGLAGPAREQSPAFRERAAAAAAAAQAAV